MPVEDSVVTACLVTDLAKVTESAAGALLAPIVALGLQGPEAEFPPGAFEEAFNIAREGGLASVPHAGMTNNDT